ncbi:MAG TPA: response regulator [Blastocatellia bacterium]|nr:response regulator [Blastocatellia bacterium]
MSEILIVDDEELIRSLLLGALSPNFSCSTASNVAEAKTLLASGSFKVVLTDINMPGASGLDLLAHVKQEHQAIVVVVMSASGLAAAQALAQGAFDLIEKPFDLLQLTSVIRRAWKHALTQPSGDTNPE